MEKPEPPRWRHQPHFNPWELFRVLYRIRLKLILALFVGALLGYGLSTFRPPIYQASASILLEAASEAKAEGLPDDVVDDWLAANRALLFKDETLEAALTGIPGNPSGFSMAQLSRSLRIEETRHRWDLGIICHQPAYCEELMQGWLNSSLARLRVDAQPPEGSPLGLSDVRWQPGESVTTRVIALGRITQTLSFAGIALLLTAGVQLLFYRVSMHARVKAPISARQPGFKSRRANVVLSGIIWYLWLGLLFLIPLSSSPLVTAVFGFSAVSPLALYPLIGLCLLFLLPHLLRQGSLPKPTWMLLFFVITAGLSICAAGLLPLEPLKGYTPLERGVRASITVGIGLSFYLVTSVLPNTERRMKSSLKALYAGAFVAMLWGSVQATFVLTDIPRVPYRFELLHSYLVIRHPFEDRISGLAYEPSWFADQLVVLYLPLWIGSVMNRYSVFTRGKVWFTFELIMSLWGTVLLALTFSRIGYLAFLLIAAAIVLWAAWRGAGWIIRRTRTSRPGLIRAGVMVACVLVLIVLAFTVVWFLSLRDRRMTSITALPAYLRSIQAAGAGSLFYHLASFFGLSERFVYWEAGLRTFWRYPLLGVGLGNSGLLFPQFVPQYGMELGEIQQILSPAFPFLANPKNLWVRLLAETGLVGMLAFTAWLGAMAFQSARLLRSKVTKSAVMGTAGLLALLAILVEGLSLDTFALPQMWVLMGLVSSQLEISEEGER